MQLTVDRGQLPLDWKIKTLGEVCNISTGKLNANAAVENGKYLFFTCSREIFTIDHFAFDCEAILLAGNNAVGDFNVKHYKGKFNAYQRTYVITINKGEPLLYKYLYLQVESALKDFKLKSVGAGTKFLKLDMIKNLKLHLPPLPEQKRIVAILNEAFEGIDRAIANTEKNLANSREVFESYLNAIFTQKSDGWLEKKLGDISEVQSGGTPSRAKSDYWGGQIAWYSSGELNDLYTTTPERNITDKGLENSNAKLFPKGSLLIGMYDTAALKMSILDRKGAFNQAIAGVKPNNEIDLIFILHAINFVKPEILSLRRGVRQKNLSLQKIKNIILAVPELQKQQRVVRQLASMREETQRLEAIYRQKLAALNELKQSILQKAFTGELTADTPKTVKEKIAA